METNKLNEHYANSSINYKSPEYDQNWYNGTNGDCASVYYGVYIPCDIQIQDNDAIINVFQDKLEALKLVKKYKKARFKAFHFYHEAADFAVNGAEQPNNDIKDTSQNASENPAPVGEKPSPYRGPKSQDLVKLRKAIETGNVDLVRYTIWENPRYLISVGDTPSILHEGFRYNALHVAAKFKNELMCKVILGTISDVNFIKLLYGDENHQDAEHRSNILVDLYLNTPDKGLNETPLHFAAKYGALEVIKVFVSFAQCDKSLRNKYNKLASEIICDRCEKSENITSLKQKITLVLEDNFYVPVLRSEDNCMPPLIGEPFSPTSPPRLNKSLLDSRLEIHAYAGPMEKEEAEKFRKMWKTPPRGQNNKIYNNLSKLKFKDPEKGLECLGRVLASKHDVGWKEYWPFLNTFIDLASQEGLELFEDYLKSRVNMTYDVDTSTSCVSSSSSSEQVEKSSTNLNNEISPITDLCNAFQMCTLNDYNYKNIKLTIKPFTHVEMQDEKKTDILQDSQLSKNDLSPFLYVEKTCQVFANRISNDIIYILETEYNTTNIVILEMQMKQLMSVISSFRDDSRFSSVNFQVVHSRLSSLICEKLHETINEKHNHNLICQTLEKWLDLCGSNLDCFSSDDESINQRQCVKLHKKSTSQNKQVICLLKCILTTLNNDMDNIVSSVNNEEECIKVWSKAKACTCILQAKHVKKNSFIKRHDSFKFSLKCNNAKSNGIESVSRKLTFYTNNGADFTDSNNKSTNTSNDLVKAEESNSSDDEFYTPPTSPTPMEVEESDEDIFNDSRLPEVDVFIEGDMPTKLDYAAYVALCSKDCNLNSDDYPHIYKWFHTVSLYTDFEREQWTNSSFMKCSIDSPSKSSTPNKYFSQPSQILRTTPLNSPRSLYESRNLYNL